MLGMIKSEVYKLFNKKSFYVCALILMGLAGLGAWFFENTYFQRLGIPVIEGAMKQMGFTAWDAVRYGAGFDNIIIMNSIFS